MPKQKLILILGVVLALITAFLVKAWMDQQRDIITEQVEMNLAQKQERFMSILFAKKEIPAGSPVTAEYVEERTVPERQVMPQSVASLDRVQGMIAIADILQGEPLTVIKLAYPKGATGLAAATPVGRRAISVSVDAISALAGMVKPGDYVDVVVTIAVPVALPDGKQISDNRVIPLFQNVEVLAVNQNTVDASRTSSRYAQAEKSEEARPQNPLITLSLTPKEAGILAYISEQGKIRLILRNPSDSKMEPLEIADLAALFRYLSPEPVIEQPPPPPPKPIGYVEVWRSVTKEKVPINE